MIKFTNSKITVYAIMKIITCSQLVADKFFFMAVEVAKEAVYRLLINVHCKLSRQELRTVF